MVRGWRCHRGVADRQRRGTLVESLEVKERASQTFAIHAFFVAGAPTVVVSQWKVDSASTTTLVLDFHRLIRKKLVARRWYPGRGCGVAERNPAPA
jgi:hypothetical protein